MEVKVLKNHALFKKDLLLGFRADFLTKRKSNIKNNKNNIFFKLLNQNLLIRILVFKSESISLKRKF
jgi:hypothetical protein